MLKIRVFKKGTTGLDGPELHRLLDEAECVEVDVDGLPVEQVNEDLDKPLNELEIGELGYEETVEDDVTLIVVLTSECIDDPQLEEEVGRVVGRGGRAVGVWPKGGEEGDLPPILEKIGSGVVAWDPKALKRVLTDVGTVWDTPVGEPRLAPKTKRNNC
jgi:hypothetical protein